MTVPSIPSSPRTPSSPSKRSLRSTASASSLPHLRASPTRVQHAQQHQSEQPTLADLINDEQERLQSGSVEGGGNGEPDITKRTRQRRRSSAPLPGAGDALGETGRRAYGESSSSFFSSTSFDNPQKLDLRLLPPHYGRPSRPSSPDVLATLLRPVLQSLASSRPSSLNASPLSYSPSSSLPGSPPPGPATVESDRNRSASSSLPAHFPPRAPTDPAPTIESQGFVLYIGSLVAYAVYLIWAFVPSERLEKLGIEWFPSQEWALLIPAWFTMLMMFAYASYFFLNLYNTPPLSSLELLVGDPSSKAFIAPPPRPLLPDGSFGPNPLFGHAVLGEEDLIPPLYDLPIEWVNKVLYAELEDEEDDEEEEK